VFSFNLIGYPAGKTYDGNCGDGHRIFVNWDAHSARVIVTNDASLLDILWTVDTNSDFRIVQFRVYSRPS
jgi:hypothetical protein